MSAGPQITWDAPQAAPPPQVQWDEEKPKTPEKKSFMQSVRDWMPEGIIRRGLEKGGEWAGRKAQESTESDLRAVASGEKNPHPMSSYSPTAGYGMMESAMRTAGHFIQPSMKEAAVGGAAIVAPEIVGPAMVGHGGYTAIKHAPGALKGNPEEAEAALGGASEAAMGGAMGSSALVRGTPKTFTRNALEATHRTLIKGEPPAGMVPEAPKAMTQAIQPGVNIPRAQESIQIAGPRMKQVMEDEGVNLRREKGDNAVPVTKKALDVIKTAKQQVHAAIEDRLGPVADLKPSTAPVADAMEQSISGRTERQSPKDAEAIRKRADTYRGNLSLREIENSIQDANNELRNYYKRSGGTDSPTPAHMDATLAEVKTLRSLLDEKVESLSGDGVKDLKREYGALRDVERATAKQHAIATRTKEGGLWEGLAYMHAAGDLLSGNALGAARAGGAVTVGRMLKNLRDPNYLLEQAFHGPKSFEAAERIAPHAGPPTPAGLLNAPPTPGTPAGWDAPDTSGTNRGQSGRWTTPVAQLPERHEIPATFLREIPRAAREAVRPKGLLTNGETPPMRTPPPVQDKFARETTLAPDETRLGATGEGGIRIPIKGLLPAAREAMGTPPPSAPKPSYTPSEKAATMSEKAKDYGPEFNAQQAQEEINRNQAILRNPKATAEERGIASDRLRDAKEPTFGQAALKAAKEPEPVETKIKGITAEEPKPVREKREVAPPIEQRFSPEEITDAEGLLASEAGAMASADRPGVYFDENPENQFTPQRQQSASKGVTSGGSWRGVKSGREMYPFMREHPEMNPEAVLKALRNKDSAFYKRAMESAIEFVNRGKDVEAEERAAIAAEPPEWKTPEGVFPGMGGHVRAQEAGAGKVKAEELAREMNTPRNIEGAAGEMETKSPLFRGTEASPQREIFSEAAIKAAKKRRTN